MILLEYGRADLPTQQYNSIEAGDNFKKLICNLLMCSMFICLATQYRIYCLNLRWNQKFQSTVLIRFLQDMELLPCQEGKEAALAPYLS